MDETMNEMVRRRVAEALTATGHDAAGRAMLRSEERAVVLYEDVVDVYLACRSYDVALLSAMSPSTGGHSRALDDAYLRFYGWLGHRFAFHLITPASPAAEELLAG